MRKKERKIQNIKPYFFFFSCSTWMQLCKCADCGAQIYKKMIGGDGSTKFAFDFSVKFDFLATKQAHPV